MTTPDKAKIIVAVLQERYRRADENLTNTRIRCAGQFAMNTAWEDEQKRTDNFTGGFGGNPYSYELSAKEILDKTSILADVKEVLDFALDHFLSMVKE